MKFFDLHSNAFDIVACVQELKGKWRHWRSAIWIESVLYLLSQHVLLHLILMIQLLPSLLLAKEKGPAQVKCACMYILETHLIPVQVCVAWAQGYSALELAAC